MILLGILVSLGILIADIVYAVRAFGAPACLGEHATRRASGERIIAERFGRREIDSGE